MKTKESRFQVHDELTAPERSLAVLKGALAAGGQLSNILGVLAGSPATLRAYARFRSELRHGTLPLKTQQRIALGVAEHEGSEYALAMLQRTARDAGLGLDEIARARELESSDEREAALLAFVKALDAEYRQAGVRANAVLPSVIDTPANRSDMPGADTSKWVPPEQIARVIRFLCSDDSEPTSGAAVPVYGRA